ncbi:MAG TPA: GNAT family N-acetyltransferase [Acidobacteriota bacterium]|nr:GNAT family N-acetyltransferase [Acidobacteriota bacterium]
MTSSSKHLFADLDLSRRLEKTEGEGNRSFVEARAQISPEVGAEWTRIAGTYALFDGPRSPLTQTFGLGIFQEVAADDLQQLEDFFLGRQAPVFHEVSPLAHPSALHLLGQRGYRPIEFTSVLYRPIAPGVELRFQGDEAIRVRIADPQEADLWASTAAEGWSEYEGLPEVVLELGKVNMARPDAFCFLAELEGFPIAAGALSLFEGVALLAGASTIPAARRRGAQLALLQSRLQFAAEQGCDLAMMCAQPGTPSQRNAQRHNFQIAYTRIKWQLFR